MLNDGVLSDSFLNEPPCIRGNCPNSAPLSQPSLIINKPTEINERVEKRKSSSAPKRLNIKTNKKNYNNDRLCS
jgi:hypothetical protein